MFLSIIDFPLKDCIKAYITIAIKTISNHTALNPKKFIRKESTLKVKGIMGEKNNIANKKSFGLYNRRMKNIIEIRITSIVKS